MVWVNTRVVWRLRTTRFAVGLIAACAVGGVGALALASRASHEETTRVGEDSEPASPAIAATGPNGFVAVWAGADGVMAADAAAGRWGSAERLSSRAEGPGNPPQVAGAPSGATVLAWETANGAVVYARYRPGSQARWQSLTALARSGRYGPGAPEVAIDAHGDAFVVVGDQLHVHRADATGWDSPRRLRGPGRIVSIASTPRGTLALLREGDPQPIGPPEPMRPHRTALWLETHARSGQVHTFELGQQGGPALQGDASPFALNAPVVTTNNSGGVQAAWQTPAASDNWRVRVALLPSHANRPSLVTLREPGLDPTVAPGPDGSAIVLWDPTPITPNRDARAAIITPSAHIQRDSILRGIAGEPAVTADTQGNVAAIGRTSQRPRVFLRAANQRWCATQPVGPSSETAIAINSNRIALLWHRAYSRALLVTTEAECRSKGRQQ